MEKQLQVNEPPPIPMGTPHMAYKKSHSGSTGNIHGLVGLNDQIGKTNERFLCNCVIYILFFLDNLNCTSTKLTTFTGGVKTHNVQMRRPTNKRGKTAPAPPKRTR